MKIDLTSVLYQILETANSELTRSHFIRNVSTLLTDFFKCAEIVQVLKVPDEQPRYEFLKYTSKSFSYNTMGYDQLKTNNIYRNSDLNEGIQKIWEDILDGKFDITNPCFSTRGTFKFENHRSSTTALNREPDAAAHLFFAKGVNLKSILIVPYLFGNERIGLIQFKDVRKDIIAGSYTDQIEEFAQTLGIIMLNQYSQAALQERVKELSCLYSMSIISKQIDILIEDLLYRIMELIPPAWQYPDITLTRIILDGIDYSQREFIPGHYILGTDIFVDGKKRGVIEVAYTEKRVKMDEGPFLKEERKLIDTIANELGIIIKRRETEEEKINLKNQLHHADRLATVGELAAGVAHELNEPLGSIMGFAQLASKNPGLPRQAEMDLEKIVKSSLHAREIIKKLMSFSRATQPEKKKTSINRLVEESIYFLKSRCHKSGISLTISTDPGLVPITVDPVQIEQVLTNILVNAMQAMPDGGSLELITVNEKEYIKIIIRDSGHGMSSEVKEKLFNPFFTTKKAGKGIGLGLSVVKGIIDAHKGEISITSDPGLGSEFEILLPKLT